MWKGTGYSLHVEGNCSAATTYASAVDAAAKHRPVSTAINLPNRGKGIIRPNPILKARVSSGFRVLVSSCHNTLIYN